MLSNQKIEKIEMIDIEKTSLAKIAAIFSRVMGVKEIDEKYKMNEIAIEIQEMQVISSTIYTIEDLKRVLKNRNTTAESKMKQAEKMLHEIQEKAKRANRRTEQFNYKRTKKMTKAEALKNAKSIKNIASEWADVELYFVQEESQIKLDGFIPRHTSDECFVAVMRNVHIENILFGDFQMLIPTKQIGLQTVRGIKFYAGKNNIRPENENDKNMHPHINKNELCFGNCIEGCEEAMKRGNLAHLVNMVRIVLGIYNQDSPHLRLESYPVDKCDQCSKSHNLGKLNKLPGGQLGCNQCTRICKISKVKHLGKDSYYSDEFGGYISTKESTWCICLKGNKRTLIPNILWDDKQWEDWEPEEFGEFARKRIKAIRQTQPLPTNYAKKLFVSLNENPWIQGMFEKDGIPVQKIQSGLRRYIASIDPAEITIQTFKALRMFGFPIEIKIGIAEEPEYRTKVLTEKQVAKLLGEEEVVKEQADKEAEDAMQELYAATKNITRTVQATAPIRQETVAERQVTTNDDPGSIHPDQEVIF